MVAAEALGEPARALGPVKRGTGQRRCGAQCRGYRGRGCQEGAPCSFLPQPAEERSSHYQSFPASPEGWAGLVPYGPGPGVPTCLRERALWEGKPRGLGSCALPPLPLPVLPPPPASLPPLLTGPPAAVPRHPNSSSTRAQGLRKPEPQTALPTPVPNPPMASQESKNIQIPHHAYMAPVSLPPLPLPPTSHPHPPHSAPSFSLGI